MIFCGIEETSFNDFPGKLSCVIFVSGCNFFCPYCHNPQTVLNYNDNVISMSNILNFIKQRRNFYDGVVVSGGEPTLNEELPILFRKIKEMGYYVKLDTNGSRPNMLMRLLKENIVDYIAMDIKEYPSQSLYKQFTKESDIINNIIRSIELIMAEAPDYEFRTTCVKPFITSEKIKQICKLIYGAKCYTLQPFNKKALILNKNFFADTNPNISRSKISEFVKIASTMVKQCRTIVI